MPDIPSRSRLSTALRQAMRQPFHRGAILLAATSGLSYGLGLLRDRALAGTFGASDAFDVYQASFIIPDVLFNLFVAGALTSAFIPIFTDLRTKQQTQQATNLAGIMLTAGILLLTIVGAGAFLLARPLTALVAPGFPEAKQVLLANVMRIMLLSPLLFFVSNLVGGMLISTKRFLFYGLSPALYNAGIIIGTLILAPTLGAAGVAIGTIFGAVLHVSIRIIDARRAGLKLIPRFTITPEFKKVVKLMLPRTVGLMAVQAQLWAFVAIASTVGEGAVTIVSLARNFQSFPVSLIGIAFATSLFPHLAESASKKMQAQYNHELLHGIGTTLAIVIPATIALYLLRTPLIALLLGTGQFDAAAVAQTAMVLGIYTLSIPTESMNHILSRAFYALHNTLIPVTVSVIGIVITITTAYLFTQRFGTPGIPAGFAIGTALQTIVLLGMLRLWSKKTFTIPAPTQS